MSLRPGLNILPANRDAKYVSAGPQHCEICNFRTQTESEMRSHTVGTASVVDRHCFHADPGHSIVMPIRIRIGIKTMPIRMRILSQVLNVMENFLYFYSRQCQFTKFFYSHKWHIRHILSTRCAADFSLLNLPKGKSLGRSKPATNS
jgi:hypothetical protein